MVRGGITLRKFIASVLCAALLVTSAGASNVYEVEGDTSSFSLVKSSAYDVMTTDLTSSDLASYLGTSSPLYKLIQLFDSNVEDYLGVGSTNPSSYSISWWVKRIIDRFGLPTTGVNSTFFGWLPNLLTDFSSNELGLNRADPGVYSLGYYLKNSVSGFDDVVTAIDLNTTAVGKVESAVDDTTSAVDDNTIAVNATTSAVEDNTTAVNATTSAVEALYPYFLYSGAHVNNEGILELANDLPFPYLLARGFVFLRNYLSYSGAAMNNEGSLGLVSYLDISDLISSGFIGLRSVLLGSSNAPLSFSGVLVDNQNQISSFSAAGIAPMLQKYLQEIQHDSGLLTYIFASPEDLEMKENSSSNMSSVNDTFINPESSTSLSPSDIGSLGSAAGSIEGLGQTGVTPDQAFTQLSNDSIFEFFTATTASNLDTTVSAFARRDLTDDPSKTIVTDYYEQSRIEFYDLIGEGVG